MLHAGIVQCAVRSGTVLLWSLPFQALPVPLQAQPVLEYLDRQADRKQVLSLRNG